MKETFKSPQVVAALITSFVAIFLAVAPTVLNNNTPAAPLQESPITTVPTEAEPTIEAAAVEPTATDMPAETTAPTSTEVIPTDSPSATPTAIPPTIAPTEAEPTPMPTATQSQPPNIQLIYDEISFTIYNQSAQTLALDTVSFQSTSGRWDVESWGVGLVQTFPPNNCLRMRDVNSASQQPPAICGELRALQLTSGSTLFWIGAPEFDVINNGAVIATCSTTDTICEIFIP